MNLDNRDVTSLYLVPNEAILDSVIAQLYRQFPKSALNALPEFKNISVNFGVTVGFEKDKKLPQFKETFSYQIMELMDAYMKQGIHIVFLIDEAQKHTGDLRILINTYQDLVMRDYLVSMVLAGLPAVVSDIINDDVLTFLRRAKQVELENIEQIIVEHEFKKTFNSNSASLSEDIVLAAASGTYGYPYMIQLVGYYLWEQMHESDSSVILNEVMFKSKMELFRNVHKLVFAGLSNRDREFIFAMSEDESISSVSMIGERLQKNKSFISLYRDRLISAGVVKSCGQGLLCFNYPYMREFLLLKKKELE